MASASVEADIYEACKKAALDPRRKGILFPLGQDHSRLLLDPKIGLPASVIHRHGLHLLVWKPHDDFASCLPAGIICPCCKTHKLVAHEQFTSNVRKVMGRDRTILMIGSSYRCNFCTGKGVKGSRSRSMANGAVRSNWASWDSELLQVLPAEVQQQFPVILNSGIAMHRPLFDDLCSEGAAGKRSFEEWVRSHIQRQHTLFYNGVLQWLYYKQRCESQLQHPRMRSSSADTSRPSSDVAPAADQEPVQQVQPAPAPAVPAIAGRAASAGATAVAGASSSASATKPAAKSKGAAVKGNKMTQMDMRRFAAPRPAPPSILGSSTAAAVAQAAGSTAAAAQAAGSTAAVAQAGGSTAAVAQAGGSTAAVAQAAGSTAAVAQAGGSTAAAAQVAAAEAEGDADAAEAEGTAAAAAGGQRTGSGSKRKAAVLTQENAGFGGFEELAGWAGFVPSAASVIGLFIAESAPAVAAAAFKQLQVGGELWKGDHNYKFVKCVRKDGHMVYAAVFTVMNEINQVVAQFLTEDSSWDALVPKIEATCARLQAQGLAIPHTVYLDNTVSDENSIRAAVPGVAHVQEDHFHAMRRVTSVLPDDLPEKTIIIGQVKNALLPIYQEDRRRLREYCTTAGCGMGVTRMNKKTLQPELTKPMMTTAEFAKKPASFFHKYCRHTTPSPAEQERRLREIPTMFAGLQDPSKPGELLFREGGPVVKGLEQLILLVRAGKLQDPLPVDQMYHNDFAEVPGKLTVPRSKRSTSQLEGYHGAALNHVVRGYNTSSELAIPQLTLTNHAWNIDRLVAAGKAPQYHCYDLVLLQKISSKLQRLGFEPLAGVGNDLLPYLVNDQLDVEALRRDMQNMAFVSVEPGVLPATQKEAEQVLENIPEGEDDVLAAEWFKQAGLQPPGTAAAAGQPLLVPVAPWLQESDAAPPSDTAAQADAARAAGLGPVGNQSVFAAAAAAVEEAAAAGRGLAAADAAAGGGMAAAAGEETAGPSFAAVAPAAAGANTAAVPFKVGGHGEATLDVAMGIGAGTAILGKRSHASRRGATYAEMVQPVLGTLEWDLFRRLLRDCTTRKGINWHLLGDMWDEEMEKNPLLTPKSATVFKAAERNYSHYLALKRSVCVTQGGDSVPTGRGGSTPAAAAVAAAAATAAADLRATPMGVGPGVLPFLQVPQATGTGQLVGVTLGQQAGMLPPARAVMLPQFNAVGSINPQLLTAAGLVGQPANQAAILLQQQQLRQALLQQQLVQQHFVQQQFVQQQVMQQQGLLAQQQQQQGVSVWQQQQQQGFLGGQQQPGLPEQQQQQQGLSGGQEQQQV